jgi:hypothetical protein
VPTISQVDSLIPIFLLLEINNPTYMSVQLQLLLIVITLTTLPFLNLSLNGFTSELPLLTGSCAVLDLSNNKFEGNIDYLNIGGNLFAWSFPEVTSQFSRLSYLNLYNNHLNDDLPKMPTQ